MALVLLSGAAQAQRLPDAPLADSREKLVEVRVEGNRRVELEAVKRALRNKEGEPFDPALSADDLRALWALNYFADISLLVQRLPSGGVAYIVRVTERPSVREVTLKGNDELSKDDLKESIDIRSYSILDLDAIRRNAKKIQDKYVEKGFFLAEVTHEISEVPDTSEVDVTFVIREHAKVMVKEINFLGAVKVSPEELKAVMATREGGFLSFLSGEGTYREEAFARDVAVIQNAYFERGFVNVKVDKGNVSLSPDKRYIYITLKIEEGEPYNVGALDFSGDLLASKEELFERMGSRTGQVFNRSQLFRDIQLVTDVYYDQGYAYANITPVTAVHAETRTIDLTFDIQKGQQVTIERIDIVGNTKTRDLVIRRQLRVYEGELFSGTGMRKSKERVTQLGFFETVEVSHKPGKDNQHVTVQVEVKEKSTGTFQVGFGFSNYENFIFTAQISQSNFLGWGQAVSANLQLSGQRNFVQLSFFDPYFLDTNFIFSADFYRTQADYIEFLRDAIGGSVSLGYQLAAVHPYLEDVTANIGYTAESVRSEAQGFTASTVKSLLDHSGVTSAVRFSASWDRRDNRLFPTRGLMLSGTAELAPAFLGGSLLLNKYSAFTRFYFPLPFGIVFKTNFTFGYIQQLEAGKRIPPSEAFRLGGISTVRGYGQRTIGPTELFLPDNSSDLSGPAVSVNMGGNKQFIANFELEFPVFEKVGIRGVLFYDAGNAFAAGAPLFQDREFPQLALGLFHSVGFGFRWFSPIGPLRFEWGIPLFRRTAQDQPILFEFTIGNSF
jgi:outer membrane protein insertion porin family